MKVVIKDAALLCPQGCDVYFSEDRRTDIFVGSARGPCTEANPFKLPVDKSVVGTSIYLSFVPNEPDPPRPVLHEVVVAGDVKIVDACVQLSISGEPA